MYASNHTLPNLDKSLESDRCILVTDPRLHQNSVNEVLNICCLLKHATWFCHAKNLCPQVWACLFEGSFRFDHTCEFLWCLCTFGRLNLDSLKELLGKFADIDKNKDGLITFDEFSSHLKDVGSERARILFDEMDKVEFLPDILKICVLSLDHITCIFEGNKGLNQYWKFLKTTRVESLDFPTS